MSRYELHHGDSLDVLRGMPDASVDAVVTDPPYGLGKEPDALAMLRDWLTTGHHDVGGAGFMGRKWDAFVPQPALWREALRVLKPGGHVLAFAGTRTMDLMALGLRIAGFELRDSIGYLNDGDGAPLMAWVYGSGFPKSLDVSKAIDRMRHDSDEKLQVTSYFADVAERNGVTRADVDAHMGTSDMGGWWLSRLRHRCAIPTLEQIPVILEVLKIGVEDVPQKIRDLIIDLNGMKGQPGAAWFQREVVGRSANGIAGGSGEHAGNADAYGFGAEYDITAPATDAARQWQGWGTALKPAWEPIIIARKPMIGTVAENVLQFGTGALNIDGCRVAPAQHDDFGRSPLRADGIRSASRSDGYGMSSAASCDAAGRWPANLIHDGSDAVIALFPQSNGSGGSTPNVKVTGYGDGIGTGKSEYLGGERAKHDAGSGSAARFFYCAKASKKDRNAGCEHLRWWRESREHDWQQISAEQFDELQRENEAAKDSGEPAPHIIGKGNVHETVKPTALMAYLCRLVTPPGGVVVDAFMGSGSTGVAAMAEGFRFIGVDKTESSVIIARARISHAAQQHKQPADDTNIQQPAAVRPCAKPQPAVNAPQQLGLELVA